MATRAGGIVKAHAIAARHPSYPGNKIPGVVGVYVVPPDTNPIPGQGAAPIPTSETLAAVATSLSATTAYRRGRRRGGRACLSLRAGSDRRVPEPLGCRGHRLPVRADEPDQVSASDHRRRGRRRLAVEHPLLYTPLILFLMSHVKDLGAIPSLTLVIDGRRLPPCSDFTIEEDSLFWSLQHEIVPSDEEGGP